MVNYIFDISFQSTAASVSEESNLSNIFILEAVMCARIKALQYGLAMTVSASGSVFAMKAHWPSYQAVADLRRKGEA